MWLRAFPKLFHVFFGMIMYGGHFVDVKVVYYMEQARYFGSRGAADRAIHYCNRALELDADNFYALAGLAATFVQRKEFHLALEYANKALSSSTKNVPRPSREALDVLLAVTLEMLGKSSSMKTVVDKIANLYDGDLAPVYAQLGRIYFGLGIYEKAKGYYEEVRSICPKKSAPYYNLGRVYYSEGNIGLARQQLMNALELAEDRKRKKEVLRQLQRIGSEGVGA